MKPRSKKIISYILTIVIIATAACWVASRFIHWGNVEFTENAQVMRQIVPVNARVRGYIKEIRFNEFEKVNKGDTLVIIDDVDMLVNLALAKADYKRAVAGVGVADRGISLASVNVGVSESSVEEARTIMNLAHTELQRYSNLLAKNAVTQSQFDAALTDYEAKKSRYEMLSGQRLASVTAVDESRDRLILSQAAVESAEARLAEAELNLSYCVILSPCDGFTSRKEIQVGQLIQPGQTLLDVVDSRDIWVNANYKETQLHNIHPGAAARIKVDAIPGVSFNGAVVSISTATGSSLSVLPQDNSSGNFVKVRQRIPVRIEFSVDNDSVAMSSLRAGMNAECTICY